MTKILLILFHCQDKRHIFMESIGKTEIRQLCKSNITRSKDNINYNFLNASKELKATIWTLSSAYLLVLYSFCQHFLFLFVIQCVNNSGTWGEQGGIEWHKRHCFIATQGPLLFYTYCDITNIKDIELTVIEWHSIWNLYKMYQGVRVFKPWFYLPFF